MIDEKPYKELTEAQNYYLLAASILKGSNNDLGIESAVTYLNKAAELGLNEARYQLGIIYFEERHLPQDQLKAFEWFQLASDDDYIPAKFALATLYSQQEKYSKAFEILNELAARGVTEAQTNLADFYLGAKGVEKDAKKAVSLLTQSAEKGDRLAQYRLGLLCYQGQEVVSDYIKARKYIVMAMEQKLLLAYFVMGSMLEHGFGIDKDVVRAYTLYCFCQHYGMPNLNDLLDDVLGTMNDMERHKAKQLAREYCHNEPAPE